MSLLETFKGNNPREWRTAYGMVTGPGYSRVCVYSVALAMLFCCLSAYISLELGIKDWEEVAEPKVSGLTMWLRVSLCVKDSLWVAVTTTARVLCHPACSPHVNCIAPQHPSWDGLLFSI